MPPGGTAAGVKAGRRPPEGLGLDTGEDAAILRHARTAPPHTRQPAQLTAGVCVIHLIRGTFRYASKRYWEALAKDMRAIYTAPTAAAAWAAFEELEEKWGKPYPAIPKLWRNAWDTFIPFLDYDVEIRRVLCSTNAIESLNARFRRAVNAKGHFPTEQAASKTLYLVVRSLDPKGLGQAR